MKSLKKIIILLVVSVFIFSFSREEYKKTKINSNKEEFNAINILTKQKSECRFTSKYLFYVETKFSNDRTPTINAKIFMLNRLTGKAKILASEKIKVSYSDSNQVSSSGFLNNGDEIIGDSTQGLYSFKELIKFESIYSSYIKSTNELLKLKRDF